VARAAARLGADVPTGFVVIELRAGRHHSLMYAPGANDHLTWTDIAPALDGLESGDIVIVQAEVPVAALFGLALRVKKDHLTLYVDPTPPDRCTSQLLEAAEVITPNRAEAASLAGRADNSPLVPALAASDLLRAGARRVLVVRGQGRKLR
jgi:ribokinase